MPYLLMSRAYEYNDEYYSEQEGGYPDLVFEDAAYLTALAYLEAQRHSDWTSCTPLESYYHQEAVSDLSSSGFSDEILTTAIAAILGQELSAEELLETDFSTYALSDEQTRLIALLLDRVGRGYLEYVEQYR